MRPVGRIEEWFEVVGVGITAPITAVARPNMQPLDVVRWGFLEGGTPVDFGASTVIRLNKRVAVSSDTGKLVGAGGTMTLNSTDDAFTAEQTGVFTVFDERLQVNPGEQLEFEVVTGATAGTVHFWYQYEAMPFVKNELALVDLTYAPNPDRLVNMTKV